MLCFFSFEDIGLIVFCLGLLGIYSNRRNILISIISIEIMLYGLNLYLTTISLYLNDILGEILSFFILSLAASESALALALLTAFFRVFLDIVLILS